MFTGIIEEMGMIRKIRRGALSASLEIEANEVLKDVKLGDSISVNGVCLTVTRFTSRCFSADVMNETMNRSILSEAHMGDEVNLERAMKASDRFGGHFVSGHVDGTGQIVGIRQVENARIIEIKPSFELMRYIVEKGSIAIDGISLTVMDVKADTFSVSVIPHTWAQTTLKSKKPSDKVNLETDMIGKYIERLLPGLNQEKSTGRNEPQKGVSMNLLSKYGYF